MMAHRTAFGLLLAVSSLAVSAQAQDRPASLHQICGFISARTPDRNPNSPNNYAYQTVLFRDADVDVGRDSTAEIRRKMQVWWSRWGRHARCNSTEFNVPNGSTIKYAVSRRWDVFINDFADWGVNLNYVDPTDNRTVLDYIEDEIVRLNGTTAERTLSRYYRTFRDAGALHRRELREVVYTQTAPGR